MKDKIKKMLNIIDKEKREKEEVFGYKVIDKQDLLRDVHNYTSSYIVISKIKNNLVNTIKILEVETSTRTVFVMFNKNESVIILILKEDSIRLVRSINTKDNIKLNMLINSIMNNL